MYDLRLVGLLDIAYDSVFITLAFKFRGILSGDHNKGDLVQDFLLLQAVQYLKAVHHGHQIVQQHHGDGREMAVQKLYSLLAVGGFQYLVFRSEYTGQNFPFYCVVLED